MTPFRRCLRSTVFVMAVFTGAYAQVDSASYESQVVASFPHYVPQQQVSGVIRVSGHGSATNPWMRQLLIAWEKDLQRFQPGIRLEYRMYGTSSAIPALFNGVADRSEER